MSSITDCQGESLGRLFQTTPLSFAPSPPYRRWLMLSTATAVGTHCRGPQCWWECALSLRWGRIEKSLQSLRRGVGKREYWGLKSSIIIRNTARAQLFSKHMRHSWDLPKKYISALFPVDFNLAGLGAGGVGVYSFLQVPLVMYMIRQIWGNVDQK